MQASGRGRSRSAILTLMANEHALGCREALTDRPPEVQITVTVLPRARRFRERSARSAAGACMHGRAIAAAAIVIAAALIIAAPGPDSAGVGGGARTGRSYATIATAYPYPSRGLLIKISAADPSYARADVTRRSGCGRYCVYDGVILHRVSGSWRIVLKTANYSCPVASLPPRVQAELAVCTPK